MGIQDRKVKVLISAYACEPHKGSEPGVGWNWAKQIATFAEAWVITRVNNKDIIEEELNRNPAPNLHFVYIDLPKWISFWKKGQRGVHLYYYLWLIWSYTNIKKLAKSIHFDLFHHLTFGVYSSPCFLSLLPTPFIWGPIGGVDNVPGSFRNVLGTTGRVHECIRDIAHRLRFRFDPFVCITMKRSKLIICRTKRVYQYLKKFKPPIELTIISETGCSSKDFFLEALHQPINNSHIKIFSAGRLVPLKGFILAIEAFARFYKSNKNSVLEIAGSGHELNRLKKAAENKGIIQNVRFLGELPRKNVIAKLMDSDIFLYPSLREGGTWAVMEALSCGKPIVCLDYSGPGEMLTKECGIKVKPITPEQTIKELTEALLRLASNPGLRKKMGEAGRKRVEGYYTWDKKGEFIQKVYQSVLDNESSVNS